MPVPFGFGISDFVAVGQLALRIYKSCKAAPDLFATLSGEVQSLYCVLQEAAETQVSHPLPPPRQARLKTILEGCENVLTHLESIIYNYRSLGTDDKSPWDRLRLGKEDIADIRGRLVLNITLLTSFRSFVIGTLPSEAPAPNIWREEYGSWQWVVELSGPGSGPTSPQRSIAPSVHDNNMIRSETDTSTLVEFHSVDIPPSISSNSRPRLGGLFTGVSGKRRKLINAIDSKDASKALSCLDDEATINILDQDLLDQALWSAARYPSVPLMKALLEKGANKDAVRGKKNVLWVAVSNNNIEGVKYLLEKKVNLKMDNLWNGALPLRAALRNELMMNILAKAGAPLDAEYEVSSAINMNILQEAVSQGREQMAHLLITNGAKIDACSSTSGTALMIALSMGRGAIAKLLILKGANVNFTRQSTTLFPYSNPVEAAILGRAPGLLELVFSAGASTDMPQAMRFALSKSDYPLIPSSGSQYGYDYEGTKKFYQIMVLLAERDLRYVMFFHKRDSVEAKREGIMKMMQSLKKSEKIRSGISSPFSEKASILSVPEYEPSDKLGI